jgi:type VI secretion system protein VasG
MLRGIAASYEKHHGVRITYEGIRSAVTFSNRYISGRQLPDKAVDVLDTAAARVKMSQTTKPASLDGTERSLLNARLELKTLLKDTAAGIMGLTERIEETTTAIAGYEGQVGLLTAQWEKEKTLVAQIVGIQDEMVAAAADTKKVADLRARLDGLNKELETVQGENPMVFPHVSAGVCGQVVGDWTGIPVGSLLKDEAQTLLELDARMGQRVLGQDEAIAEIASAVRSAKTGMGNPDAPLGVFLFTGPSGVGKTEAALGLADLLFGGEKFLTVINMSEYQEKHTVSQLKGSPPGYVGYGEGGVLTEAVRQKPYSLVLLDEVEKAHLEVMNLFYQVFDKGFMRDGEGREINFRNTLIIMTSNLGSDTIVDLCADESAENPPTSRELLEAIRPRLSSHFQPALLGRCKVIPFRPLSKDIMRGVVALKLDKLAGRIEKAHGLAFSCSPELVDQLAESCTTVESGARNADLVIDQNLTPAISRQLLQHMGEEGKKYSRLHVQSTPEGDFEILFSEADDGDLNVNSSPVFEEKAEKKTEKKLEKKAEKKVRKK